MDTMDVLTDVAIVVAITSAVTLRHRQLHSFAIQIF